MEVRHQVIEDVLHIEELLTDCLQWLFRVSLPEESKTLGYRRSALAAKTKMDLLSDFNLLPPTIESKIQKALEIRNKFAHVRPINSFSDLSKVDSELLKYLIKNYPKSQTIVLDEKDNPITVDPRLTLTDETKYSTAWRLMILEIKTVLDTSLKSIMAGFHTDYTRQVGGIVIYERLSEVAIEFDKLSKEFFKFSITERFPNSGLKMIEDQFKLAFLKVYHRYLKEIHDSGNPIHTVFPKSGDWEVFKTMFQTGDFFNQASKPPNTELESPANSSELSSDSPADTTPRPPSHTQP